jgi:hypothetical protein
MDIGSLGINSVQYKMKSSSRSRYITLKQYVVPSFDISIDNGRGFRNIIICLSFGAKPIVQKSVKTCGTTS